MSQKNEIICIYDIKKADDEDDVLNCPIKILNCYEVSKEENEFFEGENNEKEIEENCDIYLDGKKIDFCFKYEFEKEGKYTFKFVFKKPLTNLNYMFNECDKLISIDLSNFDSSNVKNMDYMFEGCTSLTSIN